MNTEGSALVEHLFLCDCRCLVYSTHATRLGASRAAKAPPVTLAKTMNARRANAKVALVLMDSIGYI